METRVVTPDTGVRIDGEEGGEELREKEEEKGDVKRSSFENKLLFRDTFKKPEGGDNNCN